MAGETLAAIREAIPAGTRLETPAGRAKFLVEEYGTNEVVLLFGKKRRAPIPAPVLDRIVERLRDGNWVRVAASRTTETDEGAVETIARTTASRANYLVALFARAGLVDVALNPTRIRAKRP